MTPPALLYVTIARTPGGLIKSVLNEMEESASGCLELVHLTLARRRADVRPHETSPAAFLPVVDCLNAILYWPNRGGYRSARSNFYCARVHGLADARKETAAN